MNKLQTVCLFLAVADFLIILFYCKTAKRYEPETNKFTEAELKELEKFFYEDESADWQQTERPGFPYSEILQSKN